MHNRLIFKRSAYTVATLQEVQFYRNPLLDLRGSTSKQRKREEKRKGKKEEKREKIESKRKRKKRSNPPLSKNSCSNVRPTIHVKISNI